MIVWRFKDAPKDVIEWNIPGIGGLEEEFVYGVCIAPRKRLDEDVVCVIVVPLGVFILRRMFEIRMDLS